MGPLQGHGQGWSQPANTSVLAGLRLPQLWLPRAHHQPTVGWTGPELCVLGAQVLLGLWPWGSTGP